MLPGAQTGFLRRESGGAALAFQRDIGAGRKRIVGVNAFQQADDKPLETLVIDGNVEQEQVAALRRLKAKRSAEAVKRCLSSLRKVAATKQNVLPALLEAARTRCTVGEIMQAPADG